MSNSPIKIMPCHTLSLKTWAAPQKCIHANLCARTHIPSVMHFCASLLLSAPFIHKHTCTQTVLISVSHIQWCLLSISLWVVLLGDLWTAWSGASLSRPNDQVTVGGGGYGGGGSVLYLWLSSLGVGSTGMQFSLKIKVKVYMQKCLIKVCYYSGLQDSPCLNVVL